MQNTSGDRDLSASYSVVLPVGSAVRTLVPGSERLAGFHVRHFLLVHRLYMVHMSGLAAKARTWHPELGVAE